MKKIKILLFLIIIIFTRCTSQNTNMQVLSTTQKAISYIKENNSKEFISLIAHKNLRVIGKNEEMIIFDINKYHDLFIKYLKNKEPVIDTTELFNNLGQRRVKISICNIKLKDSITNELHLNLLFGPPNYFLLNKITGYQLIENNSDSLDFKPVSDWK